jgi:hypothetical protein
MKKERVDCFVFSYLLTGNTETELSKNLIERIEAIQTLDSEAQKNVFALLDAFLRDYRTKQAYK